MLTRDISITGSLVAVVVLGALVYLRTPRRTVTQCFLLLSLTIGAWLFCLLVGFRVATVAAAEFWIRQASVTAACVPSVFNLLRLSISHPQLRFPTLVRRMSVWLVLNALVVIMCQTSFFLHGADLPSALTGAASLLVAEPDYGPGRLVYIAYYVVSGGSLLWYLVRDLGRVSGMRLMELQYLLLGCGSCIAVGVLFGLILPLVSGNSQSIQAAFVCTIILEAVIAYGIVTRRIMDVGHVVRCATAYTLLAVYLGLLYIVVWHPAAAVMRLLVDGESLAPHILASLAVAFSLTPANTLLQRVASGLLINLQSMNVPEATRRVNRVLRTVTTVPDLLTRFSAEIQQAVGTDRVLVLMPADGDYQQRFPEPEPDAAPLSLPLADILIEAVADGDGPVVRDELPRFRPTPELDQLRGRMLELDVAVAVRIRFRQRMVGTLLLGSRLSGRVYGGVEQNALQALCDQLAVALENARLYTDEQDSKIYNEILLNNLLSGVIAVNRDGLVTVFNREAQLMTRLSAEEVIDQPYQKLPEAIAREIRGPLAGEPEEGQRDQEVDLEIEGQENVPLLLSASSFRSQAGELLGALVVFNDLTTVKKLEQQVRRGDRLASIGTLSAGMAHEIKNPMVVIKTFAQLLPERYQDAEFRNTFSSLLNEEIGRIDRTVNHLLNFSRESKPKLEATHLHGVLQQALRLVEPQSDEKQVRLERALDAANDLISADFGQLQQAFLNLFLNAIDSTSSGGELHVTTDLHEVEGEANGGYVRVHIRDTGKGIDPKDLPHIFDPFYTTKGHGTGLGLSVAHGIIDDHGGLVDVESEPDKGATFVVALPLIEEQVPG